MAVRTAGENHDHVRAQALQLALHQVRGALADGDHRGDGGNADDHAEHGEPGAHLVLAERRSAIRIVNSPMAAS